MTLSRASSYPPDARPQSQEIELHHQTFPRTNEPIALEQAELAELKSEVAELRNELAKVRRESQVSTPHRDSQGFIFLKKGYHQVKVFYSEHNETTKYVIAIITMFTSLGALTGSFSGYLTNGTHHLNNDAINGAVIGAVSSVVWCVAQKVCEIHPFCLPNHEESSFMDRLNNSKAVNFLKDTLHQIHEYTSAHPQTMLRTKWVAGSIIGIGIVGAGAGAALGYVLDNLKAGATWGAVGGVSIGALVASTLDLHAPTNTRSRANSSV